MSKQMLCGLAACGALLATLGGCPVTVNVLQRDAEQIAAVVDVIQTEDPRTATPTAVIDAGYVVTLGPDVEVITVVQQDLVVSELPDITLLGFENVTGFDIFVRFMANGVPQSVFVFDGETVLLSFPCLQAVQLLSEDDFDPFDAAFIQSFDLISDYLNPDNFLCGDAFIITFDPEAVIGAPQAIDLVP